MAVLDARDLADGEVIPTTVCVAGAGAAGITIARQLASAGVPVVLLEGGGIDREEESQALYLGQSSGQFEVKLDACRSRHLGGSTNCWVGWCRPLESDDFERRDWLAGSGWPVSAEELVPYYALAHRTVQIGASEYDADALAQRAGVEPLPLDPALVRWVLYQYSPPIRFGESFRGDLETTEGLRTYLHANVVNIALDNGGGRVSALEGVTLSGIRFSVQADHYVISMGGIDNARLLLASNTQQSAGVGNGTGLVGACFMEHPHYYQRAVMALRSDVDPTFWTTRQLVRTVDAATPEGIEVEVRPAIALPPAIRQQQQLVTMAATAKILAPDRILGDMDGVQADQLRHFVRSMPSDLQLWGLDIRAEQRPRPQSRVTLTDELDPVGMPRVNVAWNVADEDIADVQRTLELWSAALARARLGRVWMATTDDRFDPGAVDGGCHHMGTTRMSDDAETGVVNADGRVHGLDNLFVAGSSVFPTGGFANPTLTIVALAHRLAEHIGGLVG